MNPGSIEAKKQNISGIARTIYDHPLISRKELGQRFGLSASTVTLAVNTLLERGLIMEGGQEDAAAGRKAQLLQIRAAVGSILSVQLSGNLTAQLRLCDLCGKLLADRTIPAPLSQPEKDRYSSILTKDVGRFLEDIACELPLMAVSVIIPGVMNADGTADLPVLGWEGLDLRPLGAALGVPLFCDTILHMVSGYEIQHQPPADRQIYLSLEPGVGMSCHEQGRAITSRNLLYGEVGHISMHEDGPPCYCGNRGCLEYYCGIPGILSRMAAARFSCPILSQAPLTLEGLTEAAAMGSAAAQDLLTEAATELGRALVTIRNMLDPDQIILSGRLWQIPSVRATALELVRRRTLSHRQSLPQFLTATLTSDQYEIGVCHYTFNRMIDALI